jgi:hypothetical protein
LEAEEFEQRELEELEQEELEQMFVDVVIDPVSSEHGYEEDEEEDEFCDNTGTSRKRKRQRVEYEIYEFVLKVSKVRLVQLDASKWENSKCTCTSYLMDYICFHIAALAVSRKMTHIHIAYKAQPIGIKPKRGRPSKAASAFVKQ